MQARQSFLCSFRCPSSHRILGIFMNFGDDGDGQCHQVLQVGSCVAAPCMQWCVQSACRGNPTISLTVLTASTSSLRRARQTRTTVVVLITCQFCRSICYKWEQLWSHGSSIMRGWQAKSWSEEVWGFEQGIPQHSVALHGFLQRWRRLIGDILIEQTREIQRACWKVSLPCGLSGGTWLACLGALAFEIRSAESIRLFYYSISLSCLWTFWQVNTEE